MDLTTMFDRLWADYSEQNPSVNKIFNLLKIEGEEIVNDHIAFRTLNIEEININVLAQPFIKNGYIPCGEYFFRDKHLYAKHYELAGDKTAPRIFISQLLLEECSDFTRDVFSNSVKGVKWGKFKTQDIIFAGQIFEPLSFEIYNKLREESEYAAWFYVFGFRANHFTISINALKKYDNIVKVNDLLKRKGFILNRAGGEVKGSPSDLLQQSSTMADLIKVKFVEGEFDVPSCYYEFAQRYHKPDGELYNGFIAKSADKIFESTNLYNKD